MAPEVGFEPAAPPLDVNELGGSRSLIDSPDAAMLLKVVAAWPRLSGNLKIAVLAIVESATSEERTR
jgi:hypothetical protein